MLLCLFKLTRDMPDITSLLPLPSMLQRLGNNTRIFSKVMEEGKEEKKIKNYIYSESTYFGSHCLLLYLNDNYYTVYQLVFSSVCNYLV